MQGTLARGEGNNRASPLCQVFIFNMQNNYHVSRGVRYTTSDVQGRLREFVTPSAWQFLRALSDTELEDFAYKTAYFRTELEAADALAGQLVLNQRRTKQQVENRRVNAAENRRYRTARLKQNRKRWGAQKIANKRFKSLLQRRNT